MLPVPTSNGDDIMTDDTYALFGVFLWSIANRYPERESIATYSRRGSAQGLADRLNADGGNHVVREIVWPLGLAHSAKVTR